MARNVTVMLPNGTTVPVSDVPDDVTDQEIKRRVFAANGITMESLPADIAKSGLAGVQAGMLSLPTMLPKAIVGTLSRVNQLGPEGDVRSKGLDEYLKGVAGRIKASEQELGPDYQPQTKAGEYAASMGAALPTAIIGPGPVAGPLLAAGGGALSQAAHDLRLGPAGEVAGAALPDLVYALLRGGRPGGAFAKVRHRLGELTPTQEAIINRTMATGREPGIGLNPRLWQAAPPEAGLRTLGEEAALHPAAKETQALLQTQLERMRGPSGQINPQGLIKEVTDPVVRPVMREVVSPELAQGVRSAVGEVTEKRVLAPGTAGERFVRRIQDQIGKYKTVPWTTDEIADEITRLGKEIKELPAGDPGLSALKAERTALIQGKVPTRVVFDQNARLIGHLENIRQGANAPLSPSVTPDVGTKMAVQETMLERAGRAHPPYKTAIDRYGDVKDVVSAVHDTAIAAAGKHGGPAMGGEARIAAAPEAQYALATSFPWAMVPITRRWAERRLAKDYDKLFRATSIEELAKAAQTSPQREMLLAILQGMALPGTQSTGP